MYGYLDIYIEIPRDNWPITINVYYGKHTFYFIWLESPTNANGKSNLIYPPFNGEGNKNILL